MEYFFYIPQEPNKKWVNANKAQNIPVTKYLFFFKKKKINWNNYFELFDINCRYHFYSEITQPLLIFSKSIELELCYVKLTTIKFDPR